MAFDPITYAEVQKMALRIGLLGPVFMERITRTATLIEVPFDCIMEIHAVGGSASGAAGTGTGVFVTGAGAAEYAYKVMKVTAGSTYVVYPGAGGASNVSVANSPALDGKSGSNTGITGPGLNMIVMGGGGGRAATAASSPYIPGGLGGTGGTGGDFHIPGGDGGSIAAGCKGNIATGGGAVGLLLTPAVRRSGGNVQLAFGASAGWYAMTGGAGLGGTGGTMTSLASNGAQTAGGGSGGSATDDVLGSAVNAPGANYAGDSVQASPAWPGLVESTPFRQDIFGGGGTHSSLAAGGPGGGSGGAYNTALAAGAFAGPGGICLQSQSTYAALAGNYGASASIVNYYGGYSVSSGAGAPGIVAIRLRRM